MQPMFLERGRRRESPVLGASVTESCGDRGRVEARVRCLNPRLAGVWACIHVGLQLTVNKVSARLALLC